MRRANIIKGNEKCKNKCLAVQEHRNEFYRHSNSRANLFMKLQKNIGNRSLSRQVNAIFQLKGWPNKTAHMIMGSWTHPRNISPEWNEYDRLRTLLVRQRPRIRWEIIEEDRFGPKRWRVQEESWTRPIVLTRATILQWMRERVLGPAPPRAEETAPVNPYY